MSVKYQTSQIDTWFIFKLIITIFSLVKVLMSDQGTHFLNSTIHALNQIFMIYHQKRTPLHPQANGMLEEFNTILEKFLMEVCNVHHDDWDQCIPIVLWVYHNTCKKITKNTPFILVYSKEVVIMLNFVVPRFFISIYTRMIDDKSLQNRMNELMELEENRLLTGFIQLIKKNMQKEFHDRNINTKLLERNTLLIIYDSKFFKNIWKLQMRCFGPF